METKNEKVRRLVSDREYKQALQICKDWDYKNPMHGEILRLGYECLMHPRFYRQLGYDSELCYKKAIQVLEEVYGNSPSRES